MEDHATLDYSGERYQANFPDTLDLAERAAIAINGLGGMIDPDLGHHMCFSVHYCSKRPYMSHSALSDYGCDPKFAESLPMMRLMSGSSQHMEIEAGQRAALLGRIDDGLYWDWHDPARPWQDLPGKGKDEEVCQLFSQGRMIRALLRWRELGDDTWDGFASDMVSAMGRVAVVRDDYGYYPTKNGGWGFTGAYPRSGWLNTDEPERETESAGGSNSESQGNQIYAAAQWFAHSGDPGALDLCRRLTRFCMKPKFWGGVPDLDISHAEGLSIHVAARLPDPPFTAGHEQGHWYSHFHARAVGLRGILEYARSVGDERALEFVRRAYEFSLTQGIPRIGWVNVAPVRLNQCEGCGVADLVAMGIRLSDTGLGDYWDDVDAMVRNHLIEHQLVRADLLEQLGGSTPDSDPPEGRPPFPGERLTENVIERSLGAFGAMSFPSGLPEPFVAGCCTGNGTQGLYYAWEGIVRERGDTAQVNLLLNRAAKLLDIDSHLPYEGKVVLHNKSARRISVRIPFWVDRQEIRVQVGGTDRRLDWLGNSLVLDDLQPGDEVTLTFPIRETSASYTVNAQSPAEEVYTCTFRGSTLVDISPRDPSPTMYPFYLRDHLRDHQASKAPMKTVERFVPSRTIAAW